MCTCTHTHTHTHSHIHSLLYLTEEWDQFDGAVHKKPKGENFFAKLFHSSSDHHKICVESETALGAMLPKWYGFDGMNHVENILAEDIIERIKLICDQVKTLYDSNTTRLDIGKVSLFCDIDSHTYIVVLFLIVPQALFPLKTVIEQ